MNGEELPDSYRYSRPVEFEKTSRSNSRLYENYQSIYRNLPKIPQFTLFKLIYIFFQTHRKMATCKQLISENKHVRDLDRLCSKILPNNFQGAPPSSSPPTAALNLDASHKRASVSSNTASNLQGGLYVKKKSTFRNSTKAELQHFEASALASWTAISKMSRPITRRLFALTMANAAAREPEPYLPKLSVLQQLSDHGVSPPVHPAA